MKFKMTITMKSDIAMSRREWEQVKEYLEDNGYEEVSLQDAEVSPTFQEREACQSQDEPK